MKAFIDKFIEKEVEGDEELAYAYAWAFLYSYSIFLTQNQTKTHVNEKFLNIIGKLEFVTLGQRSHQLRKNLEKRYEEADNEFGLLANLFN